jgi:hypothetical protein
MFKLASLLAVLVTMTSAGCFKTFHSERVGNDCRFKGVPTMMHKTHIASVTWSEIDPKTGQLRVTQHICTLPVMYAVDVCPAPVGKTEADFKLGADGQLTEASAKLDQEIPELIRAIGEAAKNFIPATGRAASGVVFTPGIDVTTNPAVKDYGYIVNMSFQELDLSKGCNTHCGH